MRIGDRVYVRLGYLEAAGLHDHCGVHRILSFFQFTVVIVPVYRSALIADGMPTDPIEVPRSELWKGVG